MCFHHTQATSARAKQNVTFHGTTTSSNSIARKDQTPLAPLLDWFSYSQIRRPYITQLCLTPLIYCLGDLSAQMIGDDDSNFDYQRSLRSIIIGLVIALPSREWFLFLGWQFNYNSLPLSLGAKVAADQIFYTPMSNVYFFASHGLLAGDGLWGAIERVKNTVPTSIPRSFLYWPLVTAINFSYVRPQSRSLAASGFAVFWQSYLSWLNSSAGNSPTGKEERKRTFGGASLDDLDRRMLMFDDN